MPQNDALPAGDAELKRALIEPRAVAIVGASGDAAKAAGRPLAFLRQHGFAGKIYPVNPGREAIMDIPCYPSIPDLPGPVDHAFVTLPAEPAIDAVRQCGEAGVKVVTLLADGFAESGREGIARQRRLVDVARDAGCRVIGPNSIGLVRTHGALTLTANAAFASQDLPKGRHTVLSQSGSLIGTFFSHGRARGIGFANLVSVGNEADLSIGELGRILVDDPQTGSFLLFLETIRHREHLEEFAQAARAAGKPVLAYKIGRSDIGAELAVSHTGAIVGSDRAADCFLRSLGISRVEFFETLLEAPPLFRPGRTTPRPASAAILTTTGGGGAMVADRLGYQGIELKGPTPEICRDLEAAGVSVRPGRIFDVTLAGTRYEVMKATIDQLRARDDIGVIVIVVGSSAELFPELAVRPIIDAAGTADAREPAIAVYTVPRADAALRMLADAGIAGFRTAEACADGVCALLKSQQRAVVADLRPDPAVAPVLAEISGRPDESAALRLFAAAGIPTPASAVVSVNAVLADKAVALPSGFPVVAKLLSADLPHKTEVGAVTVGIQSEGRLRKAVFQMLNQVRRHKPEAAIDGVMIQEQCEGLGEVLLGMRRDPAVGPIVTLGAGGILAEIHDDVSVRMAPVDRQTAGEMIAEVRSLQALNGYRGKPKGDIEKLVDAIVNVSGLAAFESIREAEINPVLVRKDGLGVVALDGLVVLSKDGPRAGMTNREARDA